MKALKRPKTRMDLFSVAWLSWSQKFVTVDPWLCVPAFRRVCLYRTIFGKVQKKEPGHVPGSPKNDL
jgi:hypothetical protein